MRNRDLLRRIPILSKFVKTLDTVEAENRRLRKYLWDYAVADLSTQTETDLGKWDGGGQPVPPGVLRYLVAGNDDVEWFLHSGKMGMLTVIETLERNRVDINKIQNVLDYGCGCGRVLRHFKGKLAGKIYGADCNQLAIEWCRKNLDFARFDVNRLEPPTFYEQDTFDLIYAFSVFTHLTVAMQKAWMGELWRVLKPGAYLVVSLHGDSYTRSLPERELKDYRLGQVVVLEQDLEGSNYCNAFHPETYVRGTFSKGFQVVDFIPNGAKGNPTQDVYLLQKSSPAPVSSDL